MYSAEKYVVPSYVADEGVRYKVTKLGASCFYNAPNLKEVVLPATIEEIGNGAFISCRELKKLQLNEGLKKIGEKCFKYTYSLEQITIPASVTEIGKLLFDLMKNNQQLTITCLSPTPAEVKGDMSIYSEFYAHHSLVVPSGCEAAYKKHPIWGKFFVTDYIDTATGFKYKLNAAAKTAILVRNTDADGKSLYTATNYVLPSTVKDGNGVEYVLTELGDHCFVGNDKRYAWEAELNNEILQSIVLPPTVKKIGWACFNRCLNLKDVQLPEQLEELSDSCFAVCISLDGDVLTFGNTTIRFYLVPGHTKGCIACFFDVTDGKCTKHAGYYGGFGFNTLQKEFLEDIGDYEYVARREYAQSIDKVIDEPVDIFVGNHTSNVDLINKRNYMIEHLAGL